MFNAEPVSSSRVERRRSFTSIIWNSLRVFAVLGLGVLLFGWNNPWTSSAHTWDNPRLMLVGIFIYAALSFLIIAVTQANPFHPRKQDVDRIR